MTYAIIIPAFLAGYMLGRLRHRLAPAPIKPDQINYITYVNDPAGNPVPTFTPYRR